MAIQVADLFARLGVRPDEKSWSRADHMINRAKQALIGFAAYSSVKRLGGMIQEISASADQFNKMAKQVGISSEALQQLEFAAQISGSDIGVVRTALQRFARSAHDAQKGSKMAADSFRDIGVSVTKPSGKLKQLDDLLMDVATRIASMPDGTEKTALAMKTFGRSGAQLIPMLNEGREGIMRLREEFAASGAQISTEDGAKFEEFNDTQHRISTTIKGIKNQVAIALLPVLQKMATAMQKWMAANKKVLRQRLQTVFEGLVFVFRTLGKAIAFVYKHWKVLAFAIAGAVIAKHIYVIVQAMQVLKIASLRAAAASAAAWLATVGPFVLLAAGIAAVGLLLEDLWFSITEGTGVFADLWFQLSNWGPTEKIIKAIRAAVDGLANAFRRLRKELKQWWKDQKQFWGGDVSLGDIKEAVTGGGAKRTGKEAEVARRRGRVEVFEAGRKAGLSREQISQLYQQQKVSLRSNVILNLPSGVTDPEAVAKAVEDAVNKSLIQKFRETKAGVPYTK